MLQPAGGTRGKVKGSPQAELTHSVDHELFHNFKVQSGGRTNTAVPGARLLARWKPEMFKNV